MCKSVSIYAYAGVRYLSQNANVYLFTGSISPAVLQRAARAGTAGVGVGIVGTVTESRQNDSLFYYFGRKARCMAPGNDGLNF